MDFKFSIVKISVGARSFKNTNKAEKVNILLLRSVVWELAAMVFNPEIENQRYREALLKKKLSALNMGDMISGNIKIAATQVDDILMLGIESKD